MRLPKVMISIIFIGAERGICVDTELGPIHCVPPNPAILAHARTFFDRWLAKQI